LDDARNLLRDRGVDPDVRVGSHRGLDGLGDSSYEGDSTGPRTLPAGERTRPRRKPPFAYISGHVDSVAPTDDDEAGRDQSDVRGRKPSRSSRLRDDLDHHSSNNGPLSWRRARDDIDVGSTRLR
jgi:hypothetical protein